MPNTRIDYYDRPTAVFGASWGANATRLRELFTDPNHRALINYPINSQSKHTSLFFICYGAGEQPEANSEAAKVALESTANPLKRDFMKRLPLHHAAITNDPLLLAVLLNVPNMQLFVDDADIAGQTPFHALFLPGSGAGLDQKAKNQDLAACLELLVAKASNPLKALTKQDKNGLSAVVLAAHFGKLAAFDGLNPALKAQLKLDSVVVPANIADFLEPDFYGWKRYAHATFVNNKAAIRDAIAAGADMMYVNPQSGRCPLELVFGGLADGEAAKMVLEAPTTKLVNAAGKVHASSYGRTFVHLAANSGREDTNRAIWRNATVSAHSEKFANALDDMNRTPLHAAAMASSRTTLTDAEKKTADEAEAAAAAAGEPKPERLSQREKVIDMLFYNGVDDSLVDSNGQTALQIADERGNTVVASRIRHNMALQASATVAMDSIRNALSEVLSTPKMDVFTARALEAKKKEEEEAKAKTGAGAPKLGT